jgi:hypothetical protein
MHLDICFRFAQVGCPLKNEGLRISHTSAGDHLRQQLDKLRIMNQAHLRRVMREFIAHYSTARPYQGIDQRIPISSPVPTSTGPVRCRRALSSILHDYYYKAV